MRKQEKRREGHFLVPVRGSRNLPPKDLAIFLLLLPLPLPLLPFFPSQKTAYLSEAVKRIFQRKQRKKRCSPSFLPSPSRLFSLNAPVLRLHPLFTPISATVSDLLLYLHACLFTFRASLARSPRLSPIFFHSSLFSPSSHFLPQAPIVRGNGAAASAFQGIERP